MILWMPTWTRSIRLAGQSLCSLVAVNNFLPVHEQGLSTGVWIGREGRLKLLKSLQVCTTYNWSLSDCLKLCQILQELLTALFQSSGLHPYDYSGFGPLPIQPLSHPREPKAGQQMLLAYRGQSRLGGLGLLPIQDSVCSSARSGAKQHPPHLSGFCRRIQGHTVQCEA